MLRMSYFICQNLYPVLCSYVIYWTYCTSWRGTVNDTTSVSINLSTDLASITHWISHSYSNWAVASSRLVNLGSMRLNGNVWPEWAAIRSWTVGYCNTMDMISAQMYYNVRQTSVYLLEGLKTFIYSKGMGFTLWIKLN